LETRCEHDRQILLDETRIPTSWYNIVADCRASRTALHPGTLQPIGPAICAAVSPN